MATCLRPVEHSRTVLLTMTYLECENVEREVCEHVDDSSHLTRP